MDNTAALAGMLRSPHPVSNVQPIFCVACGIVDAAGRCKRKEVKRKEGKGRGGGEAGRCDCKQGGEQRRESIRECAANLEAGREGRKKGVLLDIGAAPRSPSVERVLGVCGALITPPGASEGGEGGGNSEINIEGVRIWGGQEVSGRCESVGSVEEEESYEAQRDRQVARVRQRFQLLLQQKSDM